MLKRGKVIEFAQRMKRLRLQAGFTVKHLANAAGVSPSTLSRIESGDLALSLETMFKLLKVFEMNVVDFFSDSWRTARSGVIPKGKTNRGLLVGARIRQVRKERSLTQAELAAKIGIQQSDLCRMETGRYKISLETLNKILGVYEMDYAEFFGEPRSTAVLAGATPSGDVSNRPAPEAPAVSLYFNLDNLSSQRIIEVVRGLAELYRSLSGGDNLRVVRTETLPPGFDQAERMITPTRLRKAAGGRH